MASIAQTLRESGFRANLAVRGISLTLDRTGTVYKALVNTTEGPVDYYGNGDVQIRSEIHILRSEFDDVLPGGNDVFVDGVQDVKHVITDPPNWQHDPAVVKFMCRVEINA